MINKISVIAYSGYKSEETLRAFSMQSKRINVIEIFNRWIEERINDRELKRF